MMINTHLVLYGATFVVYNKQLFILCALQQHHNLIKPAIDHTFSTFQFLISLDCEVSVFLT